MPKIGVAVAGVSGKTGSAVTRELMKSETIEVVGGVARSWEGSDLGRKLGRAHAGGPIWGDIEQLLLHAQPDVLVDFTTPAVAERNVRQALEAGVRPLVGTSGIAGPVVHELGAMARSLGVAVAFIPNFCLGVMLLTEFVRRCTAFFDDVELVEYHHASKLDAPSGTALRLAGAVRTSSTPEDLMVPVHSIRLPGFVARHDVIFGGTGERLVLSHETVDRAAFAPGVELAIRRIMTFDGVARDLAELLNTG